VGSQDQVSAAYGGMNHIIFNVDGSFSVRPVTLPKARLKDLNDHLMLFYTGIKRTASNIATSYLENMEEKKRQLRITKDLVDEALSILNGGSDLMAIGELLHEAWQVKRSLSSLVSNPKVDGLYENAMRAGALGGKLTGAGGGGFLLLFVPPDKREAVRKEMNGFIHVPFKFDHLGSQIIFYEPETDYSLVEKMQAEQEILPFTELVTGTL
jgi:D-glycero-alpha-D-manno-heptose-7-phosphate kinase